ncbi:hypothetical protein IWW36_004081 [Coemansia brasiliensis]|uniref:Uncharacterized protein n=1 Tax=Coemansia brasiliensis TaxID=2650707 RepID=A0A9W8IAE6_9FUNG|nr:hypothetical protein IWW36_004081 [Coemansia brasiliensis]
MFGLGSLPSPILVRIIAYSDPATWWSLKDPSICTLMSSTSFRCGWLAHLVNKTATRISHIDDIDTLCCSVLQPITDIVGSDSWISPNFVRALSAKYPEALNTAALGLVQTLLLNKQTDDTTASLVVQHSNIELDILMGKFVRKLVVQRPELGLLEWLEGSGLDFAKLYHGASCFDMSLLIDWVMSSRIELLQFLACRGLQLPVRSLMEYALGHSNPGTVAFLMSHGASHAHELSWHDLLLMACTEATTRLDVFTFIVSKTEPSIVWSFAASCLASHAMVDDNAYKKFVALRNMPQAAVWMVKPIRGRTPIECLCERLTYENLTYVSPFIRDYIALGVPTSSMPSIVFALCQ